MHLSQASHFHHEQLMKGAQLNHQQFITQWRLTLLQKNSVCLTPSSREVHTRVDHQNHCKQCKHDFSKAAYLHKKKSVYIRKASHLPKSRLHFTGASYFPKEPCTFQQILRYAQRRAHYNSSLKLHQKVPSTPPHS